MIANQNVGGSISRTLELDIKTGLVYVNKEPINTPNKNLRTKSFLQT